jgi:hypothetical protein
MLKWAVDAIPNKGLASGWEGQNFQPIPKEFSPFNVDVFLRQGADRKWRWFLRYPWGELTRELPEDHLLVSPKLPIVMHGAPRSRPGQLAVSDPRQPLVLFRYQANPQGGFDAAQAQGMLPEGTHPGIMVWIEPAK